MPVTPMPLARVLRGLTASSILPALFPVLALASYRAGGEALLTAMAVGLPMMWLVYLVVAPERPGKHGQDSATRLEAKAGFEDRVEAVLARCRAEGGTSAAFMIEIDDPKPLADRFGDDVCDQILDALADRLQAATRGADMLVRLADWRIGLVLEPVRRLDLETALQMAARLQSELEDPVLIDSAPVYITASVGFCLAARAPSLSAPALIDASAAALCEARRHGPGAIRAFSRDLQRSQKKRAVLRDEAARALDDGQICAWFQPQISTDTGRITGVEALARWRHPTRGLIPPGDFLAELDAAGLSGRLGEVMLFHALGMMRDLENTGIEIAQVGVNFSATELQNPRLPQRLRWELDRFDLDPSRLAVEILEQVVAGPREDVVTRNIAALAEMGCRIDLDDFGTGHASITNLRRFAVDRLKIDRSFIVNCDRDAEQQRMVTTILTMADRLGLDTLAEGVETVGENALLAQLGCRHVQGFGIAPPMPAEDLPTWIAQHEARIFRAPQIVPPPDHARRRSE